MRVPSLNCFRKSIIVVCVHDIVRAPGPQWVPRCQSTTLESSLSPSASSGCGGSGCQATRAVQLPTEPPRQSDRRFLEP